MSAHVSPRAWTRGLLALALSASMVVAMASTAVASDDFDDVSDQHTFHDEISWLVDAGITTGYGDGTFRPGDAVTRQAYMTFLYRMAGKPDWAGCDGSAFSDVSSTHRFCDAITWGAAMGLTTGYPDGTFRPGDEVTRQAAAAFQYRGAGSPEHDHTATFSDVSPSHRFRDAIAWMDGEGIATGYPDGTFKPGRHVTRQAAAAFLFRQDAEGFPVLPGAAPGTPDYAATPSTTTHLPEGAEREYAIDTLEAATVTIELAVCDNVTTSGGAATFAVDDESEADVASFGEAASTISDVQVDGVPYPGIGTGQPIAVDGGTLTFTVEGADAPECVVPVVFSDQDGDGLDVTQAGLPTEPFGLGGSTTFSDVTGVWPAPASDVNPFDTEHEVTAVLLGGDINGDDSPDVLPLVDQTIEFRVVRYAVEFNRSIDCGVDLLGGTAIGEPVEVTTDANGVATFSYSGPVDPDADADGDEVYDCIVAEWVGSGSYEGQGPASETVTVDWRDGEGVPAALDLQPAEDDRPVDTNHTVTATVMDQFGELAAGVDVEFAIARDGSTVATYVRTTDAGGQATLTYHGPGQPAEDTITATALDDQGDPIDGASDTATVTWTAATS